MPPIHGSSTAIVGGCQCFRRRWGLATCAPTAYENDRRRCSAADQLRRLRAQEAAISASEGSCLRNLFVIGALYRGLGGLSRLPAASDSEQLFARRRESRMDVEKDQILEINFIVI